MKSLNLSGFQKESEDNDKVVFRHAKGHEITVAKKGLDSKLLEEVKKLPMRAPKLKKVEPQNLSKGGEVQKFDAGGAAVGEDPEEAYPQNQAASAPQPGFAGSPIGQAVNYIGGKLQSALGPQPAGSGDLDNVVSAGINAGLGSRDQIMNDPSLLAQARQAFAQTIQAPMQPQTPAQPDQTNTPVEQDTQTAPQPGPGGFDLSGTYAQQLKGLKEQEQGEQAQVLARGKQGTAQAQSEQDYQDQQNDLFNRFQAENDDLTSERNNLKDDIANSKINPRQYLENMSTGQHILTGLGLIVGGMGSGLTHQPNLAFQFLQSQIDRDIAAQKSNLGIKQSLLSNNLLESQNLRAATEMTRLHTNDILASQLRIDADKAANPIAKGQMLSIAGQFDQQSAQIQRNLAIQKSLFGMNQSQQAPEDQFRQRMLFLRMNGQQDLAKDLESKHVPEVGQASIPIDDKARAEMTARQTLQNSVSYLRQWAQQHSGNLNPAEMNYGQTLAKTVQDQYRRANGQGVFREAEAKFVNGIVEQDPTKFLNQFRVDPKYKALEDSNQNELNTLKKSYGLPITHSAPRINPMEGKTASNAQGHRIIMRNGKWVPFNG